MLFTDANGGNLCFFKDVLHRKQIQTELPLSLTIIITQLPVMYWEEEQVISINKRSTIVVTQTGTTIAGIKLASVCRLSELANSYPV